LRRVDGRAGRRRHSAVRCRSSPNLNERDAHPREVPSLERRPDRYRWGGIAGQPACNRGDDRRGIAAPGLMLAPSPARRRRSGVVDTFIPRRERRGPPFGLHCENDSPLKAGRAIARGRRNDPLPTPRAGHRWSRSRQSTARSSPS
jgi:hypothetical protein